MTEKSEQVTYAAAQLRQKLLSGDVEEAHLHAGLVADRDQRELLNFVSNIYDGGEGLPDDLIDSRFYREVVSNASTDALTDAVEAGNVSVMQYGVGMVDHSHDANDASTRQWLRNQLVTEAGVFMVSGGMGGGKTATALELADEWHMATRGRIGTNVESAADRNGPIEFVDSYEQYEQIVQESGDDFMMILDETGQGLSGYGDDQQQARALAKTLKLIRKGDAPAGTNRAIVLIGQTVRDASRDLRRLVAQTGLWLHKPKKQQTVVEVYGDELIDKELSRASPERKIVGWPDTRFRFDTTEGPEFDMSGALEGEADESPEDARTAEKERHAQRLRDKGLGGREIADIVGMSKTWVYEHTEDPADKATDSADD